MSGENVMMVDQQGAITVKSLAISNETMVNQFVIERSQTQARKKGRTPSRRQLKQWKDEEIHGSSSSSESNALVVLSASATDSWIVHSGATCHICNNDKLFVDLCYLKQPTEVNLEMDMHQKQLGGNCYNEGKITWHMKTT